MQKDNKKIINSWAMYDWANSVYSLVITTTIFPIYYTSITTVHGNDSVYFLGLHFKNTALYSYSLSFAFLLIAFISPILSGIADYRGNKKSFMKFFCTMGSVACASLYFFTSVETLWIGIFAFVIATIGFAGSIVFYNAFLPEIASKENQDNVSAKGFILGYIGSSLLMIFNLVMIQKPDWFGISDAGSSSRISFVTVGLWWFGFALITFFGVPEIAKDNSADEKKFNEIVIKGYSELKKVWRELQSQKTLKTFLSAFFFYNMGVQTTMYVASLFGAKEIKMEQGQLILTLLIIQFVAMAGAYIFSKVSKILGNIKALAIAVVIWIGICVSAYFIYESTPFMVLAGVVGLVMGGIQSLSRSTYSKMLPATKDHASYFSFYDVCEKVSLVLGTLCYGMIEEVTGSMRNSIFALAGFFVIGIIFLLPLSQRKVSSL
ncbi:MAG: MFS transporter [Bacteroidia bacterium]